MISSLFMTVKKLTRFYLLIDMQLQDYSTLNMKLKTNTIYRTAWFPRMTEITHLRNLLSRL